MKNEKFKELKEAIKKAEKKLNTVQARQHAAQILAARLKEDSIEAYEEYIHAEQDLKDFLNGEVEE